MAGQRVRVNSTSSAAFRIGSIRWQDLGSQHDAGSFLLLVTRHHA
jgi:hypothetical protein